MPKRTPTPAHGLAVEELRPAGYHSLKALRSNVAQRMADGLTDSGHPIPKTSPALHPKKPLKLKAKVVEREVHGRLRKVKLYPTVVAEGAELNRFTAVPRAQTPRMLTMEEL